MKLLYIDLSTRIANPTNSLIPALLRLSSDVVCYGPGFVDESVLDAGLAAFVDQHEKFDFHVMTWLTPEMSEDTIAFYQRYSCPTYGSVLLRKFVADVGAFLKRSSVPKSYS